MNGSLVVGFRTLTSPHPRVFLSRHRHYVAPELLLADFVKLLGNAADHRW